MSFDRAALSNAIAAHGTVTRVVISGFSGSSPRETGTAMLVWEDGQSGTIGGGALEWEAARDARSLAFTPGMWRRRELKQPLGPTLGQCCGGSVFLLLETFTASELAALPETGAFARPIPAGPNPDQDAPLSIQRVLRDARAGLPFEPLRSDGWFVEPLDMPRSPLFLYGAGHVGRAVVQALGGLPFSITWVDDARARFPETIPPNADMLVVANPADAVAHASEKTIHLVMTYSHALDLEVCHRVLSRGFRHLGLIGSKTKRARFSSRLSALGHSEAVIARMSCPVGDRELGKLPAAIAIGVAFELLQMEAAREQTPARGDVSA